jgi:hypothetical protein
MQVHFELFVLLGKWSKRWFVVCSMMMTAAQAGEMSSLVFAVWLFLAASFQASFRIECFKLLYVL